MVGGFAALGSQPNAIGSRWCKYPSSTYGLGHYSIYVGNRLGPITSYLDIYCILCVLLKKVDLWSGEYQIFHLERQRNVQTVKWVAIIV